MDYCLSKAGRLEGISTLRLWPLTMVRANKNLSPWRPPLVISEVYCSISSAAHAIRRNVPFPLEAGGGGDGVGVGVDYIVAHKRGCGQIENNIKMKKHFSVMKKSWHFIRFDWTVCLCSQRKNKKDRGMRELRSSQVNLSVATLLLQLLSFFFLCVPDFPLLIPLSPSKGVCSIRFSFKCMFKNGQFEKLFFSTFFFFPASREEMWVRIVHIPWLRHWVGLVTAVLHPRQGIQCSVCTQHGREPQQSSWKASRHVLLRDNSEFSECVS